MNTRMKTIVIVFNSLEIGGIEIKIIDLCNYYSKQKNIRLFLLIKNHTGKLLKLTPKNIIVISPPFTDILKIKTLCFPLWLTLKFSEIKPNLILAFGNYSGVTAVLGEILSFSSAKLIISEDSSIIQQLKSDTFPSLRKLLVKLTYPRADKIITLTPVGRNKLIKVIPKILLSKKTSTCYFWDVLNLKKILSAFSELSDQSPLIIPA